MKRAPRQRKVKSLSDSGAALSRTEALLAQLLLHSMSDAGQQKKALALRAAGLANTEIAQLMGTTADVIAQRLYIARRSRATTTHPKRSKRPKR
jgi:DNA-directed RNA polymerase specialized sigma24 family protein